MHVSTAISNEVLKGNGSDAVQAHVLPIIGIFALQSFTGRHVVLILH
jgi:hypothetical protein